MNETHHHDMGPSPFLTENLHLLPKGRALDLAMGTGRNALFLARAGFRVEGVDISPEAVATALKAARDAGVGLSARVVDLESGDPVIPREAFDVIVCFNYLHRPLFPAIQEGLRVGGVVVVETFIVDQARFGRPRNPDHLLRHNELLHVFRDFRCLRYHEGLMGAKRAVAGIIAEKRENQGR